MSIAIHHGPPGSYKTSGAIQDNLIPAILDGRTICTNVRGLDDEQTIRDNLKNVPESFKLIHIDTSTSEGRLKLATFFHWLPEDAYLLIDEVNTIYPTTLRPSDLALFDYPGGIDQAKIDKRPSNVTEAFEMHRHYNWDICCTTPHIRKVHAIIRGSAEGAYRHKNQAMVGLKGMYQEILHSADDDGKSKSNHLQMRQRRIKKNVFKLYKSTTTDKTRDTQAGRNIFLSPQVMGFAVIFLGVLVWLTTSKPPSVFTDTETDNIAVPIVAPPNQNIALDPAVDTDPALAGSVDPVGSSVSPASPVSPNPPGQQSEPDFLQPYKVYYVGNIKYDLSEHHLIQLKLKNESITVQSDWLADLGYELKVIGECFAQLTHAQITRIITCPLHSSTAPKAESPAKSISPSSTIPAF